MATKTFYNLPLEKRDRFTEAALAEFSQNNFETASINKVIKQLGIARGSVYQYFTDKVDVWLYLKEYCENKKVHYIQSVDRKAFPDFWDYYRALYVQGIDHDLQHPLCSRFLYRISYQESSQEVTPYLHDWKTKTKKIFTQWVEAEKKSGSINPAIATQIAVHFMITVSSSIADLLHDQYAVRFAENTDPRQPLLTSHHDAYCTAVNDIITLLEKALK